jgi:hypothetical protein
LPPDFFAGRMMVGQVEGKCFMMLDWWRNCCCFRARSLSRDNAEGMPGTRDAFPSPGRSKFVEILKGSS